MNYSSFIGIVALCILLSSTSIGEAYHHPISELIKNARKFVASSAVFGSSLLPMNAARSPLLPPLVSKERKEFPTSGKSSIPSNNRRTFEGSGRSGNRVSTNFVREAVKVVGPSVVRVDCEREVSSFMQLFTDAFRDGDTIKVSGSGIVVTTDGYLLTNSHVIQGAKSLTVTLSNGRTFKAAVVSFDELTDLAVLKADVGFYSLPVAPMGDSSSLASGDKHNTPSQPTLSTHPVNPPMGDSSSLASGDWPPCLS